ncbi:MAG: hypothetical protein VYE22_03590 [Myxococcota bacterium]|nr:hypothetical protein [Myxococcota bacterium]
MRYRVRSSWRTRVLLLIAVIVAGVIAWLRVGDQLDASPPPPSSVEAPSEDEPYAVDVELVPSP